MVYFPFNKLEVVLQLFVALIVRSHYELEVHQVSRDIYLTQRYKPPSFALLLQEVWHVKRLVELNFYYAVS